MVEKFLSCFVSVSLQQRLSTEPTTPVAAVHASESISWQCDREPLLVAERTNSMNMSNLPIKWRRDVDRLRENYRAWATSSTTNIFAHFIEILDKIMKGLDLTWSKLLRRFFCDMLRNFLVETTDSTEWEKIFSAFSTIRDNSIVRCSNIFNYLVTSGLNSSVTNMIKNITHRGIWSKQNASLSSPQSEDDNINILNANMLEITSGRHVLDLSILTFYPIHELFLENNHYDHQTNNHKTNHKITTRLSNHILFPPSNIKWNTFWPIPGPMDFTRNVGYFKNSPPKMI